ncbi:aminotransferase class III-fold pyridoxal phosphate-dependent enzyme [Brevibacillus fluminis]|uniref:Aminotransferase class III-fold pyridoxal phosphate-dependent enzyme n=1 Tax=Brevibacillus fluminis TaxID=511487 RepID=A0A3M8DJV8_9BACL|nr:aminotransferase class III-fold pyridoxal phosphate-dependent enzyme [Brevibacillus fluminis]RNB87675.1 aminotransferase class III-fold pyridoxal phosphate-dependent enzyme [Brevibacillus fluminis]
MERVEAKDYVFHRDFTKEYPMIVRAEGVYLYDEQGNRYLDASSGAIAANLGHGVTEIAEAMAEQAKTAGFVHTLRFETKVLHELAAEIGKMAPAPLNRVYFTSGGSEANESAMKLARQYHRDRGKLEKHIVIGRWQGYHGNTLGSLSAGGDIKRRQPYTPNLAKFEHIYSPYCHRCPYSRTEEICQREKRMPCAEELERLVKEIGPEFVSSFICEPIVGSQQGAVVPPKGYLQRVREICDQYEIVLIIDEVMTGFGRTGTDFAIEQFGVVPDIITFGKGVSAGYAPLAGMIVSDQIVESLVANGNGRFIHGYTFSGHPVSVAAGLAAVRYYKQKNVLANGKEQGEYLFQRLRDLQKRHSSMGQIRGKGLLVGFELLADRSRDQLFPPSFGAADRLNHEALKRGAVFYPGAGTIDGVNGDHLLIGPPLTITREEIDELVAILDQSLAAFEEQVYTITGKEE